MNDPATIQRDGDTITISASGSVITITRAETRVHVAGRATPDALPIEFDTARSDYDMFGARVCSTWKQELYEADTHASLGNPMNAQLRIERIAPRVLTAGVAGTGNVFTIERLDGFQLITALAALMTYQPPARQLSA
jgi:hypothetical protein